MKRERFEGGWCAMMGGNELRQLFLSFFESKGHKVLPGISLQPTDPSILLTTAGVVPFRGIIEGVEKPTHRRVATCQRCVRTVDIDSVGDESHCTFFEMLGNFSFGDYYKRESLLWGWEFLTQVVGISPERLWATIYPEDEEAFRIWHKEIGLPEDRIVRLEDNFWGPVGETGACGPDSEFHYDWGPEYSCGPDCKPGCGCGRFLEVWNHVFTELRKNEDGSLSPLPSKNIDTGMGLERLSAVVAGVRSVYDTDLYKPILETVNQLVQSAGGKVTSKNLSLRRRITDHIRACTFLIWDGVWPSNEDRGYVTRRLLRRADRAGKLLGLDKPFLWQLVPVVIQTMKPGYPELEKETHAIQQVVLSEERRFFETLHHGLTMLEQMMQQSPERIIKGEEAFRLYDTYGFPIDLTREIAEERGFQVDLEGFERALQEQRIRGRKAVATEDVLGGHTELERLPKTEFLGYQTLTTRAKVLAVINGHEIVLDRTPFYAESGGQIGDTGVLRGVDGRAHPEWEARVRDTQKRGDIIVHILEEPHPEITPGDIVEAVVDADRRAGIRRAHTATHLLHAALRRVLGPHAKQAGSVVQPDRLRFDFSHFQPVTKEELQKIEDLVNEKILEDIPVEVRILPYQEALAQGAMALFGEKYGDQVRTIRIADFSLELCGGTHVEHTGWIGLFKIVSESGVAAGVRRIDAYTGMASLRYCREQEEFLTHLAQSLDCPVSDLVERAEQLRAQIHQLEKEVENLKYQQATYRLDQLLRQVQELNGARILVSSVEGLDSEGLKVLVDEVANRLGSAVVLLAGIQGNQASLVAKVTTDLVKRGLRAGDIVREVAKQAGGGGGGRPEFAQGAVKDLSRLSQALEDLTRRLQEHLR